jgi:hypothetical protein
LAFSLIVNLWLPREGAVVATTGGALSPPQVAIQLHDGSQETPDYYEELLREPYIYEDTSNYMEFVYNFNNQKLNELKKKYNLESVAGNGDEIEKIINLMKWVHKTVGWDGSNGIKADKNALSIIKKAVSNSLKVNCRGIGIVLSEVYLSMGFKSKFVTCMPKSTQDCDCHIVTSVYSETKNKWLMMDACLENYCMDESGNILSIEEIRERFINNLIMIFPDTINANGIASDYSWYKSYYLIKNFYRFEVHRISSFGLEDEKSCDLVQLVPKNYAEIGMKDMERHKKTITSNPEYYWR